MAILFEWYENPVPNDQTDPKTIHARITLNGKVGTDEIRHKILAKGISVMVTLWHQSLN